jgi:hypothetical protein
MELCLTPEHERKTALRPEFLILFGRIRDRIATLEPYLWRVRTRYDYRGTGARAAAVAMTSCRVRHGDAERSSSRTGQSHSMGGFVGTAGIRRESGRVSALAHRGAMGWAWAGSPSGARANAESWRDDCHIAR